LARQMDIFNGATKPEWDLLRAARAI